MKSAASLKIPYQPSRRLLVIEWAAHVFAVLAVLVAAIPAWMTALLAGTIGVSLARMHKHLRTRRGVLLLHADGRLEKVSAGDPKVVQSKQSTGAGETPIVWHVHPYTTVLPFLVVLLYRQEGCTRSLVLLGDSCTGDDFRQLRLWLRWRAGRLLTRTANPETDAARSPAHEAGFPDNPG